MNLLISRELHYYQAYSICLCLQSGVVVVRANIVAFWCVAKSTITDISSFYMVFFVFFFDNPGYELRPTNIYLNLSPC